MAPSTKNNLIHIAEEFWTKWNFPNCTGAIDGKQYEYFVQENQDHYFLITEIFFSVVLLAIVDANCKFVFVDIGAYGKEVDSEIFTKSSLFKQIRTGEYFPRDAKIPDCEKSLPYVHVGDETFRLETHMMRPYTRGEAKKDYEKTIFYYRLSRARRTSENTFGLLSQVFRIFYTPIALKYETIDHLVLSALCLHNLLRNRYIESTNYYYYKFDKY